MPTHDQNYTLGRGKVYFDRFADGTKNATGERYFGHTPEFSISAEPESLDHWNADEGVKTKDESVLLQVTRSFSFSTDDINEENLALFFIGDAAVITDAGSSVSEEAIDGVKEGHYYQLGASASQPAGVRKVSSVVVNDDTSGTPTTFTEGTDYELDADLARIYVIPGGTITDGTNLRIDYTVEASSRAQVVSKNKQINGALRFVSYNAKGQQRDYFMPYVRLQPTGDFALKSDEWQVLGFQGEILQKDSTTEAIYADGRPYTA